MDRQNIAYSNNGKSEKVKMLLRKRLMNKKLTQQTNRNKSCLEKVFI